MATKKAVKAKAPRKAAAKRDARASSKPRRKTAPAFDLPGLLAEASWKDADEALAKALRDVAVLEKASRGLGRKLRGGSLSAQAEALDGAVLAVTQSLRYAGRMRNLQTFGVAGGVERFDARAHLLSKEGGRAPKDVKVLVQGVKRGVGPDAEIVLKALAAPRKRR